VVGQYGAAQAQLALRAHPPAHGAPLALYGALAAGAGRSGSLGSGGGGLRSGGADGLEALWAALEAQCARSEDVAHARAATDLLASVSLGLRKADAAGAMATRVLRQPYPVTDSRSRLVPDGGLARGAAASPSHAAAHTAADAAWSGSDWAAGAAWERGSLPAALVGTAAFPSSHAASVGVLAGGLCVPIALDQLARPSLYLHSSSSSSSSGRHTRDEGGRGNSESGDSSASVPGRPAAAAALVALARLTGVPPTTSSNSGSGYPWSSSSQSPTNSASSGGSSSSSSSASERGACLVALLVAEWAAACPFLPAPQSSGSGGSLSRTGVASRLGARLWRHTLRLDDGQPLDNEAAGDKRRRVLGSRESSTSSSSSSSSGGSRREALALAGAVQLEWLTDDLQPYLAAAAFAVVLATLATAEPSLPCLGVASGVGAAEGSSALGPYQPLGDACALAGWLLASCCEAFAPPEPHLPPAAGGADGDVVTSPGKNGGKRGGSLGGSLKAASSGRGCRPRSADDLSSPPSSPRSTSASAVVSTVSTSPA
jgi:hypothetical protein